MKIFIGCPTRGEVNYKLAESLLKLCNKYSDYNYEFCFNSKQPTDVNRNIIVDRFLSSDSDVLMFIDDDMIVNDNLFDILDVDFDIIAPITLIHQGELKYNLFSFDNKKFDLTESLINVDACGCGCVFIKRRVFDSIDRPYFKFVTNDAGELIMSETFYFYNKLKNKKLNILVNKDIDIGHAKKIDLRYVYNVWTKKESENKQIK
jgi:hypothetical protein